MLSWRVAEFIQEKTPLCCNDDDGDDKGEEDDFIILSMCFTNSISGRCEGVLERIGSNY